MALTVSVVIPHFNTPDMVGNCIRSILNVERNNVKDFEVVVVDDGSTKENVEKLRSVIESFDNQLNLSLVEHDKNLFYSEACNTGYLCSDDSSKYVMFLNSDTILIAPFIQTLKEAFGVDQRIAVVGALLYYQNMTIQHAGVVLDDNGFHHNAYKMELPKETIPRLRNFYVGVTGAYQVLRRKHIEDLLLDSGKLFNTDYIGAYEDVDLCLRVWETGYRVYLDPRLQAIHMEGKTRGVTNSDKIEKAPYLYFMEKITVKKLHDRLTQEFIDNLTAKVVKARSDHKL
jgi:GT2 family glycosyltransferase